MGQFDHLNILKEGNLVTIFVLAILFGVGFSRSKNSQSAMISIGLAMGAFVGFILAILIGQWLPTKTTVLATTPLEELKVVNAENVYLEKILDGSDSPSYVYQVDGYVFTEGWGVDKEVVFVNQIEPYVEIAKNELGSPEWTKLFGFWDMTHNSREATFYLPEASLYVVK